LSAFTAHLGLFAIRPLDINGSGEVLVQLSDAQGLSVLDIVILRPSGAAPSPDVNGDGAVNVSDLVAVIIDWGCSGSCAGDATGDCRTDVNDLVAVIVAWDP
jgi:hypothetical protein